MPNQIKSMVLPHLNTATIYNRQSKSASNMLRNGCSTQAILECDSNLLIAPNAALVDIMKNGLVAAIVGPRPRVPSNLHIVLVCSFRAIHSLHLVLFIGDYFATLVRARMVVVVVVIIWAPWSAASHHPLVERSECRNTNADDRESQFGACPHDQIACGVYEG